MLRIEPLRAASCALLAVISLSSCGRAESGDAYVARTASFKKWEDKRPSGSIIMHDMLVLDRPKPMLDRNAVLGAYVVTVSGKVSQKIDDVLNDRIPSMAGIQMNFAFQDQVTVRIERVTNGGEREFVDQKNVSFLEIVR